MSDTPEPAGHTFTVEFRDDSEDELVAADYYEVRGESPGYLVFTKPPFGPDQSAPRQFVAAYPLDVVRSWFDEAAHITST